MRDRQAVTLTVMANPHPPTAGLLRTAGPGRPKGSKNRLTVERVETAIRLLALFDPRQLIGKLGKGKAAQFTLKELAQLPDDVAACISSFDVVSYTSAASTAIAKSSRF